MDRKLLRNGDVDVYYATARLLRIVQLMRNPLIKIDPASDTYTSFLHRYTEYICIESLTMELISYLTPKEIKRLEHTKNYNLVIILLFI